MATITNGTVTSFVNTPQAGDDLYLASVTGLTEDSSTIIWLSVMANDLGGAAKVLYSLDDASSAGTAPADLLVQDLGRTEALSTDTSAGGAKIWITSDGKVGYDTATLSSAFRAQLQSLNPGEFLTDTFTYAIRMSSGALSWATVTVQYSGSNDAPVVTGVVAGNALEDGALVSLNALANVSDVDVGSTLSVVGVPASLPAGVSYNSATATFTLDPSHTAYQHLAQGQTTNVTVNYGVSDGTVTTAASVSFTITGTNDGPIAVADAAAGTENQTLMIDVLANDTDVDDDHAFTLNTASAPANKGTASVVGSQVQFDPGTDFDHLAQGAVEHVTLSYQMQDEHGVTSTSTVDITITGTNDGPVAVADTNSGTEDATITGSVATNDSDVDDGAVLTYSLNAAVAGLTLTADGSYSLDASNTAYQHLAQGATSDVVANYTVTDQHGATDTSSLTITLTGVNDDPVAVADINSGNEDASIAGSVATNDSDVDDGAVLTYSLNAAVAGLTLNSDGSYSLDAGNTAYQHLAQGVTSDVVANYTVTDQHGATDTSSLTITLTGVNDDPVAVADTNSGNEDATVIGSVATNDTDVDDGAVLTYSVNAAVAGLTLNSDGSYSLDAANAAYQHLAQGATTDVAANYTVTDQHGATDTSSLTITLTGVNDDPEAAADTNSGNEDATVTGSVATNDTDVDDGAVLTYSLNAAVAGLTLNSDGSYSLDAANAAYQHLAQGATTDVAANYTVTDQHGATDTSSLTITLTGVNDDPVAAADTNSGNEDASITGSVATNDTDVDDGAVLTYSLNAAVAGLTLNSDGSYSLDAGNTAYQHLAQGATGDVVANYTVTDQHGATDTSTLTITLTGVNDDPVALADTNSGNEDATVTGSVATNDTDVDDGAVLTYSLNAAVAGLTLAADGSYSLDASDTAYQHLAQGATAEVVANYTVTDQHGSTDTSTLTVTLTGVNDDPVAVADTNSGNEDAAVTGSVATNDTDVDDGAALAYSLNAAVAGLTLAADGSYSLDAGNTAYQHLAQGATSNVVANYTVTDQHGATDTSTLTITLTGVNDDPEAAADTNNGNEDATVTGSVATNDTDVDDGAVLTYSLNATVAGLTLNSDGSYSLDAANAAYQHLAQGATADVVANYTVTDQHGATDTSSLTITLTGTNDDPEAVADTNSGNEDATITGSVATNDSDVDDGAVLTYSLNAAVAGLTLNSDGSYSFDAANAAYQQLAAGATTNVVANYTVSDQHGAMDSSTLTVTLTGVNDAPVLSAAATPVLAPVNEDAGAPTGAVGTLVSSLVNLNPPSGGLDNVTDADNGAITGIALTGTNSTNGSWWYSTDGGTNWLAIGAVSDSAALLLAADANTRVYFQPNPDFNGTVTNAITFRAWDQTSGSAGSTVNVSTNGGTTAFSTATDTANLGVTAVNDNAAAAGDKIIVSTSTAVTISASALLANDTDIDGLALTITGVGAAVGITGLVLNPNGTISFTSGNTAGATAGSFQYTVSDGAGGTTTATVTIEARAVGGGNAADTVDLSTAGSYQASFIDGRGGADDLTGGGPGDVLIGGTGNSADDLIGGGGNDLLAGGDGNDTLVGGGGNDTLRGGVGSNDSMDGGAGAEDLLDFSDGTVGISFTLVQSAASTSIVNGTGGLGNNDAYQNMEGVIGTNLADTVTGSSGNDIIRGGGGNDTLSGAGGTDLIDFSDGTAGITFALVNNGVGTVFNASAAGLGTDTYSGFEGVIGTGFGDTLTGSASADVLRGGAGNDALSGNGGDDVLAGGDGADLLNGGIGNDTFLFNTAPNAVDTVQDFSANSADMIELSSSIFGGIGTSGTLNAADFASGDASTVVAAGVNVIYDSNTGNLYYDSTGGDSVDRTLLANVAINDGGTFDNNDIKVGS